MEILDFGKRLFIKIVLFLANDNMSSDEDFEDDDVVNLMDSGERGELDLQGRIAITLSTAAAAAADDDDDGSSSSSGAKGEV